MSSLASNHESMERVHPFEKKNQQSKAKIRGKIILSLSNIGKSQSTAKIRRKIHFLYEQH